MARVSRVALFAIVIESSEESNAEHHCGRESRGRNNLNYKSRIILCWELDSGDTGSLRRLRRYCDVCIIMREYLNFMIFTPLGPPAPLPPGRPIKPTPHHYNTKGGPIPGKLNAHIVSHTHVCDLNIYIYIYLTLLFVTCVTVPVESLTLVLYYYWRESEEMTHVVRQDDVGWLKTVDEYYGITSVSFFAPLQPTRAFQRG